jgi:DNA replication regulator SLD3
MVEEVEMVMMPQSSLPRIPQSASRLQETGSLQNPLLATVVSTPCRKPTTGLLQPQSDFRSTGGLDGHGCPPSSPLQMRRCSANLFTVHDSAVKKSASSTLSPGIPEGIQETPVRKRPEAVAHDYPSISDKENSRREVIIEKRDTRKAENGQQQSIYASLGWDAGDDIDELA